MTPVPGDYPFRLPVVSRDPEAEWSVFFMEEASEPDDEAVARMLEAVEARRHILLAARSEAALACVGLVLFRMLGASSGPTVH